MNAIPAQEPVLLINNHFDDFGEFRSAVDHWDLDFTLLKKDFDATLYYSMINNSIFGKIAFNCNIEQRGNCPEGMRTFVVPACKTVHYTWREFEIDGNTLQLFPRNGELYSISDITFNCFVISFPEEMFLSMLQECGYDEQHHYWDGAIAWQIEQDSLQKFQRLCRKYENGWIDEEGILLHALVESLGRNSRLKSTITSGRNRVIKGLEFLRSNNFEVTNLEEIVDYCKCSERSLQYAFKSYLGVSPMAYVKLARLKSVFNELSGNPQLPIVDVANKHGFWHMGQFAKDFRRVYGFLPSKLRKVRNG